MKGTGRQAKNQQALSRELWDGAGLGSMKIPMVSQRVVDGDLNGDRVSRLSSGTHTRLSVFSSVSTIRNQRYHIHANLSFAVLVAQVLLLISFSMEPGTVSRCWFSACSRPLAPRCLSPQETREGIAGVSSWALGVGMAGEWRSHGL